MLDSFFLSPATLKQGENMVPLAVLTQSSLWTDVPDDEGQGDNQTSYAITSKLK